MLSRQNIKARNPRQTRERIVKAAVARILRQGFASTTLDHICTDAGVTKGSFFHHFKSKEEMGLEVIRWWSNMGTQEYSKAWKNPGQNPLTQLSAMLDIMAGFTETDGSPCVCAIGMIAQEMALSHDEIRESCARELTSWTHHVARLLESAKSTSKPVQDFDSEKIAWFLNSLWQGSMLIGKTCQSPKIIRENLRIAHTMISRLFEKPQKIRKQQTRKKP